MATAAAGIAITLFISAGNSSHGIELSGKSDRLVKNASINESAPCRGQTWPNYDATCLADIRAKAASTRQKQNTVTVEERDLANMTSTLIRVPKTTLAAR